jgi:uncharacterized protein (TIGR00251 family)
VPSGVTLTLAIRVRPHAGRSEILGRRADGSLEVALRAAPEGGRANAELLRLLARALAIPAKDVAIVRGATARAKIVRAIGVDPERAAAFGSAADARPEPKRQERANH